MKTLFVFCRNIENHIHFQTDSDDGISKTLLVIQVIHVNDSCSEVIVTQISSSAVTKKCATQTMHSIGAPFGCTCPVTAAATLDQFHQCTRCNRCISWNDPWQEHLAPFSKVPPMLSCYKIRRIWGQAVLHRCGCLVCTQNIFSKFHFRWRQGT